MSATARDKSRAVDLILIGLIVLDVVLAVLALVFPREWFWLFHGVAYNDMQGLLRRCGGNWAAFALFQIIALFNWRKKPYWLYVVAGLRFGDIFTDWVYLCFGQTPTPWGFLGFFIAGPGNLLIGWFLMRRAAKR